MLRTSYAFDCDCKRCEQNSDSNVDYNLIRELTRNLGLDSFLINCWRGTVSAIDWTIAHELMNRGKFKELIQLWQQVYPEFYPDVTEYSLNCIFFLLRAKDRNEYISDQSYA